MRESARKALIKALGRMLGPLLSVLLMAWASQTIGAEATSSVPKADGKETGTPTGIQEIDIEGTLVCVPERMHEMYQTELPAAHEHILGFETSSGEIYTILRAKFSKALFEDPRLRDKRLLLKGRSFPRSHVFEVTRTRSVRNGTVYDLFYYCSVCSIETISPGPCDCCQGSVELQEKALRPLLRRSVPEH